MGEMTRRYNSGRCKNFLCFEIHRPSLRPTQPSLLLLQSSWNVVAHGDVREGKWRGNWQMESVASTLHTTSEHGVSSFTTADVHTSAASSRLNWRPHRIKWTRTFRRKTKSDFCACAITFQTQSTLVISEGREAGAEVNQQTLPTAAVKNGWTYISTSDQPRGLVVRVSDY